MIAVFRSFLCMALLTLAALSASGALAQTPQPAVERPFPAAAPPYGIDAKRPVFGGACMACPWGILGIATTEALKPYGYDVQMCWTCHSTVGPRLIGDNVKPPREGAQDFGATASPMHAPAPDALLDISATNEPNLLDAWNGTGPYAPDNKKRQNYRIVAALHTPNYLLAAARTDSGIKSLHDIKDRKQATFVFVDGHNSSTQELLKFYGITEAALKANRGGFVERTNREMRAAADVIIHHGLLTNTPEQRVWYEATQLSDLTFLDIDQKLIDILVKMPAHYAGTTPPFALRGLERRINTITRPIHYIYVRDDAPADFVYTLAKALDEQSHVFQQQAQAFFYDTKRVHVSPVIPLHTGAERYYRERGYMN